MITLLAGVTYSLTRSPSSGSSPSPPVAPVADTRFVGLVLRINTWPLERKRHAMKLFSGPTPPMLRQAGLDIYSHSRKRETVSTRKFLVSGSTTYLVKTYLHPLSIESVVDSTRTLRLPSGEDKDSEGNVIYDLFISSFARYSPEEWRVEAY